MTKKSVITITSIILVVLVFATILGYSSINSVKECNMTSTCVVENQEMISGIPDSIISIDKDGEYVFNIAWSYNATPGFVTHLLVLDENDYLIFDISGDIVDSVTRPIELKKGDYRFVFDFFTGEDDWEEFVKTLSPEDIKGGIFTNYQDGSWDVKVNISVKEENTALNGVFCFTMLALIAIDLTALLVAVSKKSETTKAEYDERQQVARGKAFQYSFFTLLVYNAILVWLQAISIELPVEVSTLMVWGVSIAIIELVTILIWKDAYFALNDNRTVLIGIFSVLALVDLVTLISIISSGNMIINGKLDYSGGTAIATCIMIVWILAVLLAKSIKDKKEED